MAKKKVRLLIVEDNVSSANDQHSLFRRLAPEWEIDIAYDGVQAIEAAKHKKYDIVLLDLKMPNMTGEEVLQEWWKQGVSTRVVILTGESGDTRLVMRCAKLGASDFLVKPVSPDAVHAALKKCYLTDPPMDISAKGKAELAAENTALREANQAALEDVQRLAAEIEQLRREREAKDAEMAKLLDAPKPPSMGFRLVCGLLFLGVVALLTLTGAPAASQLFACVLFFVVVLFGDRLKSISPAGAKMREGKKDS